MNTEFPTADRSVIERTYGALPQQIHDVSAARMTEMIARRIFDEWERQNRMNIWENYDGQAFRQLVDDEVHYELRRVMQVPCGFELTGVPHDLYLQTRERVLVAITRRATRLFGRWGGKTYPPGDADYGENLRSHRLRDDLPSVNIHT